MDLTRKFYSYSAGGRIRGTHEEEAVDDKSMDVYVRLKSQRESPYEMQFEIEKIEREDCDKCENADQKKHRLEIVKILYEELSRQVSLLQESELRKLERETVIAKYFQPRISRAEESRGAITMKRDDDEESAVLLARYSEQGTDEILDIRRKLRETSSLLSVLSIKAVEQSEMASSILDLANESVNHVEKAETHLKRAASHNRSYRLYLVTWFMTLSLILWFFHLI
jgi:hypothetical protein